MTTADRMAVLDKGILQQIGSAVGLFDYPSNKFVAGFVGTANLVDGEITVVNGETLKFKADGLGDLMFPKLADIHSKPGAATMVFRPHQVAIRIRDDHSDWSRVWVDGRVDSAELLGESTRYRVRVGEVAMLADQPHYSDLEMFPAGTEVRLGIEPNQVRFLTH